MNMFNLELQKIEEKTKMRVAKNYYLKQKKLPKNRLTNDNLNILITNIKKIEKVIANSELGANIGIFYLFNYKNEINQINKLEYLKQLAISKNNEIYTQRVDTILSLEQNKEIYHNELLSFKNLINIKSEQIKVKIPELK